MSLDVIDISGSQYLDLVNAEANPRDGSAKLTYYRLLGKVFGHYHTWAGSFLSEQYPWPDDEIEQLKLLNKIDEDMKFNHDLETKKFRPSNQVFTPANSWPMTGEAYKEKGF